MKHEMKHCSKCDNTFECKVGNITQCHCYGVSMTNDERDQISSEFGDCLCNDCLTTAVKLIRRKPILDRIKKGQELIQKSKTK